MKMKNKLLLAFVVLVAIVGCKDDETLSAEEQLGIDIGIIDDYLSENNITAQEDPSGLRYVVNEPGDGAKASASSSITVAYEGTLLDETVFDASESLTFPLNNLIQGWQIGIPLIEEGGDITLYIPSGLAYGPQGIPGFIPPNANLIFTIQLIAVN